LRASSGNFAPTLSAFLVRCSRSSFSFLRNSCSCGDIIATGDFVSGAVGVANSADGADLDLEERLSAGAMIVFSTLADPQAGQVTRPRLRWRSWSAEFLNQISNSCCLSQASA
jgi:hypothetical protein